MKETKTLPTFAKRVVENSRIKALKDAGKRPLSDAEKRARAGRVPGTYNVLGFLKDARTTTKALDQSDMM